MGIAHPHHRIMTPARWGPARVVVALLPPLMLWLLRRPIIIKKILPRQAVSRCADPNAQALELMHARSPHLEIPHFILCVALAQLFGDCFTPPSLLFPVFLLPFLPYVAPTVDRHDLL